MDWLFSGQFVAVYNSHNDDDVTWKCNCSFLQLFLEYFKSFDLQNVP